MDLNSIPSIQTTSYNAPTRTPGHEDTQQLPRDSFSSVTSSTPGLIDPKQFQSTTTNTASAVAAVASMADEKPGLVKVWEVDLNAMKPSGVNCGNPLLRDDGIYLNAGGTVRKYDFDGNEVWSKDIRNKSAFKTPTFDNEGNLYIVGDWITHSLDKDGNIRWEQDGGNHIFGYEPVIKNDKLYVRKDDDGILCFDKAGNQLWEADTDDLQTFQNFFIDKKGRVFANGEAHYQNGMHIGLMYVVDPDGGKFPGQPKVTKIENVNDNEYLTPDDNGNLHRVKREDEKITLETTDIAGNVLWSKEVPQGIMFVEQRRGDDGNFYVLLDKRQLICMQPDGKELWQYKDQTGDNNLSLDMHRGPDNTLYVTGGGANHRIYALNSDGSLKWQTEDNDFQNFFEFGRDGSVHVSNYHGHARIFNPATGEKIFEVSGTERRPDSFVVISGNDDRYVIAPEGKLVKYHYRSTRDIIDDVKEKAEKGSAEPKPEVVQQEQEVDVDGAILKKRKKGKLFFIDGSGNMA